MLPAEITASCACTHTKPSNAVTHTLDSCQQAQHQGCSTRDASCIDMRILFAATYGTHACKYLWMSEEEGLRGWQRPSRSAHHHYQAWFAAMLSGSLISRLRLEDPRQHPSYHVL